MPSMRLLIPLVLAACLVSAAGRTSNGNDFALYFNEAKDDAGRKAVLDEARGRPHFFRYLQIMEMESCETDGRTVVKITAFEPSSLMDICFTVTQQVSLALLRQEPVSKKGSAIAVTGMVLNADAKKNHIELGDSIIRHKDRLSPTLGKELLCEVNPDAVFYSYTAGSRPVTLNYQNRDLIHEQQRIVAASGPNGWVAFLEQEVARRKQEHQAAGASPK